MDRLPDVSASGHGAADVWETLEQLNYANIPLPLASALDLEPGETVTWKIVDRTHLLLVRLPEHKKLAALRPTPNPNKKAQGSRETRS